MKAAKKTKARKTIASGKRKARGAALIRIKRAYDPPQNSDGLRILIDRLWPRGIAKATLRLDAWVRHLAPSNGLRKWYRHDPEKFAEFRKRYRAELAAQPEGLAALRAAVKGRTVTLLTATAELDLSHATVLRALLKQGSARRGRPCIARAIAAIALVGETLPRRRPGRTRA